MPYVSWYRYAFEVTMVIQWDGVEQIDCGDEGGVCAYPNGDAVLARSGFSADNVAFDLGMLVVMMVVLRALAFLALWARSRKSSK